MFPSSSLTVLAGFLIACLSFVTMTSVTPPNPKDMVRELVSSSRKWHQHLLQSPHCSLSPASPLSTLSHQMNDITMKTPNPKLSPCRLNFQHTPDTHQLSSPSQSPPHHPNHEIIISKYTPPSQSQSQSQQHDTPTLALPTNNKRKLPTPLSNMTPMQATQRSKVNTR